VLHQTIGAIRAFSSKVQRRRRPTPVMTSRWSRGADRRSPGVGGGLFGAGRVATRLIVEEALEGEVWDALDRGYYEHAAVPRA
jgi:hypothetical protein